MWVVVKIVVPFWVPNIIRRVRFRDPEGTIISTTNHISYSELSFLDGREGKIVEYLRLGGGGGGVGGSLRIGGGDPCSRYVVRSRASF